MPYKPGPKELATTRLREQAWLDGQRKNREQPKPTIDALRADIAKVAAKKPKSKKRKKR